MTDIVERIKDAENATHALFNHIFQDAREEIERLRIENEALRAEVIHIKEVEFPRKAQAVADGWKGKCKRLEVERDTLRAKIEQMEKQEPVAEWTENRFHHYPQLVWNEKYKAAIGTKIYALPGAQTQGEGK